MHAWSILGYMITLKNSRQAMSEYPYCENVILPSHYEVKYPMHFIPKFSYLEYAHIRSARFIFKFVFLS